MDLVPVQYRHTLQLRRWLRLFAVVQGSLLLSLLLAKVGLAYGEATRRRQIDELHVAEKLAIDSRARLSQLDAERELAERRLSILDGLRGGISSDAVFGAVDQALDEGIWFLDWTFSRAGQLVNDDPKAVQTGYFLVIPLEGEDESYGGRAWRLETHMEIRGQALDHSTLARFVGRLLDQPRIQQVRIVNTRTQQTETVEVVAFELAVVVRTDA
jgi:hypothetical protein